MHAPAAILHERLSVPLIATSRIHEPAEAEALLAAGAADAVGMTRALIADPDLPAPHRRGPRGRAHPLHRLQPGLHRPLPPRHADLVPPESRARDASARCREPAPQAGSRVLVVGGGPAGLAAAVAAGRAGAAVTLVEAGAALGGQFALAGRAPAHRETVRRYQADWKRRLAGRGRGRPSRTRASTPIPSSRRRRPRDRRHRARSRTAPRSPRRPASR